MHPAYVEGQMQGGAVQGIGWALNEEYIYDANGGLPERGLPRLSDAGGLGRADDRHDSSSRSPTRAPVRRARRGRDADRAADGAIANAIEQALGIRFTELPMSPPRVLKALKERGLNKV